MDRRDNIEHRAFTGMNGTLSRGLRSALTSVLELALEKGLIHEDTHSHAVNIHVTEETRTQKFLKALRERISFDPRAFYTFMNILDGENSLKILADKMRESLKQVKSEDRRQQAAAAESKKLRDDLVISKSPFVVKSRPYFPLNAAGLDHVGPLNHSSESPPRQHDHHSISHPPIKPVDLPLPPRSQNHNPPAGELPRYRNISRTPGYDRARYFGGKPGPQSEPAVKHDYSAPMAFGGIACSPPQREDGPRIASTRSACAVIGQSGASGSLDEVTTGHAMKTFTKIQSEQHMLHPSGEPLPSTQQHTDPASLMATVDPPPSINVDTLHSKVARMSLDGNASSLTSSPTSNVVSETTVTITDRSLHEPHTGSTSPSVNGGHTSLDHTTTVETPTPRLPTDTLEQRCSQVDFYSDKEPSDSQSGGAVKSHDRLTLDELKNSRMSSSAGIEISTTAPTPNGAESNPSCLPHSRERGENVDDGISHWVDSGTEESQTLEHGVTAHHDRLGSRKPSLYSSLSLESDSSTCESSEIDPIQESKQNSDEQSPLVSSAGIMPGACSTNREKQKRQRCSRCKKLKQDLIAVKAQLNVRENMLISERENSTIQVNDLKEQLFHAEQQSEMRLRQYERDFEQRHWHAEQLIQRLKRDLQLVKEEKRGIKIAYDACLQRFEADFRRADSLQCDDIEYSDCGHDQGVAREPYYDYSHHPGPGHSGQAQPPMPHSNAYPSGHWQPRNIPQGVHHPNTYQQ